MNNMADLSEQISDRLKSGPMSANALARQLGVNPSTVSRRLKNMGDQVIRTGSGRAVRWYAPRSLPLLPEHDVLSLYRVNAGGHCEVFAHLYPVYPQDCFLVQYFRDGLNVTQSTPEWAFYESLPWWLTDMRPQGYLGRAFARQLHEHGLPVDVNPSRWSEDDTLAVLVKYPQHHVGNILVGDQAYEQWLNYLASEHQTTPMSDVEAGHQAEAINRGEHFDSSAQGEQPKFIARLAEGECIVKFSGAVTPASSNSVSTRWADLLHAEALAATVLNQAMPGIAAQTRSFTSNYRTLLAAKRFDRMADNGRIGVISFLSLDGEFVGQAQRPWPVIADVLAEQQVITEKALSRCKLAWAFGQLIANSDMHLGNISVLNEGGRPYELAPLYDMLPMHFSPRTNGDLPNDTRDIRTHPSVARIYWEQAYPIALQFWQQVIQHPDISATFKVLARRQRQVVQEFERVVFGMA